MNVSASGPGSIVDLAGVTSFSTSSGSLGATNFGTVDLNPGLTSLNGVTLSLDGTGNIPESQFTAISNGGIADTGGSYSSANFSKLTKFNGSNISVTGGGKLVLAGVTTFDPLDGNDTFSAVGTGSLVSLPDLGTILTDDYFGDLTFSAMQGGDVEITGLTTINTTGTEIKRVKPRSPTAAAALSISLTSLPTSPSTRLCGRRMTVPSS